MLSNGSSEKACCTCKSECEELESKLKEQTKVNGELKNLLLGAMGSDVGVLIENLAKDKLLLDRELNEYKTQMEKGTDDIDNLTAQADTWRSKYLAMKIGFRELISWKNAVSKQLEDMTSALRDLMLEQDRLWASVSCTYSALATLCKQSAEDICFVPEKPPHGTVFHISEVNQKLSRCLLTVFGKKNSKITYASQQPVAESTPACRKAAGLLTLSKNLSEQGHHPAAQGQSRDVLYERFHPSVIKPDSDGPIICRGCKGSVSVI